MKFATCGSGQVSNGEPERRRDNNRRGRRNRQAVQGKPVFTVSVRDGRYRIMPQDLEPEFYEIFEQACGRMAMLMAMEISILPERNPRISRAPMISLET